MQWLSAYALLDICLFSVEKISLCPISRRSWIFLMTNGRFYWVIINAANMPFIN